MFFVRGDRTKTRYGIRESPSKKAKRDSGLSIPTARPIFLDLGVHGVGMRSVSDRIGEYNEHRCLQKAARIFAWSGKNAVNAMTEPRIDVQIPMEQFNAKQFRRGGIFVINDTIRRHGQPGEVVVRRIARDCFGKSVIRSRSARAGKCFEDNPFETKGGESDCHYKGGEHSRPWRRQLQPPPRGQTAAPSRTIASRIGTATIPPTTGDFDTLIVRNANRNQDREAKGYELLPESTRSREQLACCHAVTPK